MGKTKKKYRIKADHVEIFPELKVEGSKSVWDVIWTGFTRGESPVKVGTISFDGPPERGHVHIVAEPEPEFDGSKEMKTLMRAMVDWAFDQKGVYEIEAEADHEDDKRIDLLQAAGLVYREGSRKIEQYSITKQTTSWIGLYLFIGIIAGFAIGVIIDMMVTGLAIGVFAGLAVGAGLDQKEIVQQREVTGERSLTKRKLTIWGTKKKLKEETKEETPDVEEDNREE